jgi:hypothetical protein
VVEGLIDMAVGRIRIALGLDQQQELPLVERFEALDQTPLLEVPVLEVPRCRSRAVAPPPPSREPVEQLALL